MAIDDSGRASAQPGPDDLDDLNLLIAEDADAQGTEEEVGQAADHTVGSSARPEFATIHLGSREVVDPRLDVEDLEALPPGAQFQLIPEIPPLPSEAALVDTLAPDLEALAAALDDGFSGLDARLDEEDKVEGLPEFGHLDGLADEQPAVQLDTAVPAGAAAGPRRAGSDDDDITDSAGGLAPTTPVSVDNEADMPFVDAVDAAGDEDTAIALTLIAQLTDTDGSETLEIAIEGVPVGAVLSAGIDEGGGRWAMQQADLVGLTVMPPADSDVDFVLKITATSTETASGDTATASQSFTVTVDPVADDPTLAVTSDVTGDEDTGIPLTINAALTDTDGSETLEVTIAGVPSGATLSAGTDQGGGVWTLAPGDIPGLTVTPPADNDADFTLTVTATAIDGGDTASLVDTINVTVDAVADAPTLTVADTAGNEDTAIALNIASSLVDTDGSEILGITISGVPSGASLSAGADQGGGVWTLTPAQLAGLAITPPANSDVDIALTVTATSTEAIGGDTATTVDTITVTVDPVADTPTLTVADAAGNEDTAIPLAIASALTDTDGSESLAITVAGVPAGAVLSAGSDQGGGVWTLTPAQLAGLTVTPPADSDTDFTLTVSATATDGSDTATTVDTINVTVDPLADAPTLTVADASGDEDTGIALSIASALTDTDGSESLGVTISGVPAGAALSAGSDQGGGVWTLTPAQLAGLTITPPADSDADFTLTVTSTSTEADGGATATTVDTIDVTVDAVADTPTLTVTGDVTGNEDTGIALTINPALTDTDGSESLAITVAGVPAGASLSAGSDQGGGVWTLTPAQLAGLTVTPPADSDAEFTLTVTSTSTEADGGDTAKTVDTINVTVDAVADAPTLTVADATGDEDTAIALSIASALTDTDGSENLAVTISGVPSGAALSAGSDQGGGIWTLTPAQLAGLTVTPPADSDADFTLTVTTTSTEVDGGDTATTVDTIDVTVDPVADAPTLTVADTGGDEDTAIALSISSALTDTDGSESLGVTVSGVPSGASLSAGSDQGGGAWTLTPAQLAGLTITPPADSDADFTLTVTATSTDGSDTASTVDTVDVTVDAVADAPTLTVADAAGNEDTAIALSISSALTDTDGSESLAVTISGVPSGASLSAGSDQGGGVWTLTPAQLAGLTITPPADSDADFTLTVTTTSTEADGGDTATTVDTIDVTVDAVADAPTLTVADATGSEDTAVALSISSALTDTDGSESLGVTISGVPSGASLSAGSDQGGGVWTLTPAQLAGLTITPPADSDADFTLTVTSTATEADGGDTATTVDTIDVTVGAVADAPTLTVADATGDEDNAIALSISSALTDTDGSESLAVTISGVPSGASLSAGSDQGGGVWTLTPAQLAGLTVMPPADSDADFTLTVTSTSTEADGGDTATTVDTIDVTVDAVADAPTLTVADATGNEDTGIALSISSALTDTDGSESLAVTVSGVPAGASLSAGSDQGGGVWTLTQAQLAGLTVTPPADSDADFTLTVTTTSTEADGGDTATTVDTIDVTVDAVADAPTLTVADATGNEDTAIALSINPALTDTDGSESLAVTISGVPSGASLSAGSDQGGGVWTLTPAQLAGLTITPPADSDGDFALTVTATSTEVDGGDTASTVDTINVTVDAVADAPTLTVADAAGNEDTAIALSISSTLTDTDGSESLAVTISGVPSGASLSAGSDQGGGVWTLTPAQLAGLTITPPADSDVDFTLTVTSTSTEADGGDTATTVDTIDVTVDAVADAPTLTVADVTGDEDTAIALSLSSALTDTDGSETLAVTISGVPSGASLSAGSDQGGGVWTLTPAQLAGLTITPPADDSADFTLTVTSTSTEADGGDTATTVDTFDVTVTGVADAPTLTVADVTGNEDTGIALSINAALTDSSETLTVTVAGVPSGAMLSAGSDQGGGVWTLTPAQLAGLTVTPPADSDGDFTLTVTATSNDDGDTADTVDTINVTVDAVADAPTLTVADATGNEDTGIALSISSTLTDTDGSESLAVTVSGVPAGASLSAGSDQGGGVWTLTPAQLAGLTITPPADSDADFTLTVTSTSTEADGGDTATTVDTIDVTVDPVADAPTLTVADATGDEDTAIALSINPALTDTDGSETLAVTIAGVPSGASLSAGSDQGGGVWTLTPAQLAGLTITPPADSDADFALTVTATSTDGADTASTVDTINVTVDPLADAPTLTVADATGNEDTAIALSLASALTDTDGSETLAVTIAGVPSGASLSAGSDQGGGVWTLTPAQLAGLTVTPPADSDTDFTLTVTATSTDGADTATTVDTIDVTVDPVADAPTLTVADTSGQEDTAIALSIASALTDTDGSESLAVTVSGVPAGATLSAGSDQGGGVWTLTPAQLAGLTVTPALDDKTDFTLTVTATSTDGADTATTVDTIDVTVTGVADAPTLTVADVTGNEDTAIGLNIAAALTDPGEVLSVTVAGVPTGAALSAGTDQGGGVWTLTPAQLAGLTITPPADSDGDFTLTVTATSNDDGDTADTVDTMTVTVDPVADAPTLSVADATGNEDTAIALSISSALTDTDGSESLAVTISGVPTGAALSAGSDQGGGVWTLTPAQLAGLTVTPPADSDADFTLTVTSTSTDGADTATTVDTIDVTVDPVADAPTLTVADATGDEDTAIALSIASALTDTDGSETLAVTVAGVPSGAALSAGSDQGGGVWTLTPAQLAGLTITPPADSDADFTLTVTATSTDGADTATTVDTIDVTVDPVADAPTLTVTGDVTGNEDTAIALTVSSALTDTDGSESLAVTVSGVPAGASLSAGADQGGGIWTLTQAQLAGLTVTPPADSDTDFTLTVTATSADGADTASTVDTINVTVDAVADAPTLTVADATGDEDTAIALSISSALTDTDGSESLAVTISGVPAGAALSAGSDQGGGVWTLTPTQFAGLTVTPPAGSDADFTLTVTSTSTEAFGGDTATTVDTIDVTVDAVADAPTLTVADASGDEDTAIALSIASALTDTDGSETLAVTVSGVPAGASLSAGSDQGGGVWTLTPAQLAGLTITPPADSDADFTLTVTSTATETDGGDTATTVDTIDVTVDPVADAPTLTVADASGDEDTAIALSIASALTDTDGSESLAVTISGVPSGASLSAGADQGGGVWTLTPAQLAGLKITPPADSDVDFNLTVTSTSTDGADTATTVDTIDVTVDPVADAPTLTVADATGDEDTAIALSLSSALTDTDGSESLAVTVSGVPTGATLSAGADQGGGVWTLTAAQLAGLTITPPTNDSDDFTLTVTSTSTDGADTATTVDTIDVTVTGVADAPTLTVADASGNEDTAVALSISSALTDASETLTVTVSGVPLGASLSAGSDQGGGVWTLTPAQLAGLTITPPADSDADFTLTVTATSADGGDTADTVDTIDVTVDPVADAPTLTVADASGDEDTAIALSVASALTDTDGSETLAVTISGVPSGASLSAGSDQGGGVWTLTPAQLAGLTVTPPADSDADFTLTVTATSTDGGDTATTVDTIDVTVDPVADAPTLTVADASGNEDTSIALSIASALTDTDGSETLAVTVSGVPSGASLSAGSDQGGGVWTLTPAQLAGLTVTPPADSDVDFTLTVTATSTDGSDTATTVDTIDVTVDPVADAPTLTVADASGDEDTAIALSIASALTDTDGSESLAVTVSGVPTGASLSAGSDQGGGVWTLTPAQLAGLTITPPADSDADFTLTVTSTSTDGPDTATTVDTIDVTVDPVADAPTLTLADATGDEDTAIALSLSSALTDTDGSESLAVTVSGVPSGAALSAGSDQGGGVWTLTPAQLAGLTVTPPTNDSADFTLTVTATSTDGADTATTVDTLDVTVTGVADAPTLTVADASGNEDTAIALSIASALTDPDETLAVTVSGVPSGATLSAGTDQGGGVWTLTPAQLAGLTITPPADSDGDFSLTVTATSTDGGDTADTVDTINVTVDPVADAPTLTVADATGNEDTGIALSINPALTDTDGSETLAVTVSGVPAGASLSAGSDQGGGAWTLTPAQLAGLTVTPPADSDADFTLTVTATSVDGADTATTVDTIDVTVDAVADAPTLTVADASGNEDTSIALSIASALTDTDGSESLAMTISGVPSGASLSAGSDQGGGVWTLTPAQLAGLTITPPADSDVDFTLTVTATSTDGADTATTVDTINVTVDPVADAPTLTVADVAGGEDSAIPLSISSALTDTDGSESLAITVAGVPTGATLSAGSDQGGGVWTLTPAQLAGLTVTPPLNSDVDFTLTVTATSTDGADTATTVDTIDVTVDGDADAPTLTVADATGNEDTAIALSVSAALTDPSETLSITISGVPTGANLSAGSDQGGGVWTLTPAQLAGLTITPPADSDADFSLTVTATSVDGADSANTVDTINVTVDPVADAPTLTVSDVTGNEDSAIALSIASALTDTDGSESLAVTVSGVPSGASLSAGTDQGGGVWTLTPAQLAGLTITPPTDSDADFTLTVTATSTDGADTATTIDTINVTVDPVADAPTLTVADATGNEDTGIALSLSSALTDTDGSETLAVTVSGVPAGASLSAGSDQGGGVWTLTPAQLAGLTITPPADSDADVTLTVTATSTDGADTATTVDTINVTVDAVADAPTLTVTSDVTGDEDTAIALTINSALTDTDGSETLAVTISGVPSGASLSAGTDQGGGVWTLTPAQLAGLTVTPPADSDVDFTLTVTSTATETTGGDTATTVDTINVTVDPVADAPNLTVADVTGNEDTGIALNIAASLNDAGETLTVTVAGVPSGASLSAGSDQGGGVWTLTPAQLAGLTITPPADSDADFTLTVTATSTDGADTFDTVDTMTVTVDPVADAPTLTVTGDVTGNEDTGIALTIASALTDTDGSESLAVTVSGVPSGASLSAGSDQGGGVWTLTPAQLAGLTVTPPADSDADFTLTVTATSTDGGDTASTVDTINVTVDAVADAPTLTVADTTGVEDNAIALNIASALTDTDGSESLAVTVTGVPSGASLSAGSDQGGGVWTLTPAQLAGLTVTPPAESDADFTLTITSTSTEAVGGDTAATVDTMTVTVNPQADAPTLTVADASGNEDTGIALSISSALTDTDGSETLAVTIAGVPSGASLSAGTDQGGGVWTLTPAQLAGLTITPPADSDADFTLTVTSTSTETDGGDTATTVDTINVTVDAVADAPTLTVADATGNEDTAIALSIASALTDTDGSESLAVTIAGVPTGASLSSGSDQGGGVWTLTPAQLAGLTVTPPSDSDADFTLTVTSTSSDGADTATTVDTINVTVDAVADAPTLTVTGDVTGNEDTAIALTISSALTDTDGSESLALTISGVPSGASLSAGSDQGGGVWTLTSAQLAGLTITPPAESDADFALTVTATATEADGGDTATTVDTINVTVAGVADAPTLTVADATGSEDTGIALAIAAALTDTDGSETLAVTISGVPSGASLSAGSDQGGGVWTLTAAQLAGLAVTPPADSDVDFTLTVTATATDGADTATTVDTIDVTVDAVADAPALTVADATGNEDTAIALSLASALSDTDGSETLAVTVSGVPAGATLSAGSDQGGGVWTLTPAQLAGLTVTPPADSDADFTLTVTATSTEADGGDTATTVDTMTVTVTAVADAPNLTVADATGNEDTGIALSISSALADTDGSESLAVTISGVPSGASLSAGSDQGGGIWTLTPAQLAGLTITPPADSDVDFTLTVTSTTTEATGGDTATTVDTINVTVDAVADAPTLTVADATGNEDRAEAVTLSQPTLDAAVAGTTVIVSGVPVGATLSTGSDNGDGTWTVAPENLAGIMITPPSGSSADIPLTVNITGASTSQINTDFAASADGFSYSDDTFRSTAEPGYASGAYGGGYGESGGGLLVDLGGVNNTDITNMSGGWSQSFTVPANASGTLTFSYRIAMDGDYETDEYSEVLMSIDGGLIGAGGNDYIAQVYGDGQGGANYDSGWQTVTIDLGALSAGSHTLTLGGHNNKKTTSDEATQIYFDNVSLDTQDLVSEAVTVDIEAGIPLTIASALTDTDGSESLAITIDGVPTGASLSAGTDQGGGVWTLTAAQLVGLSFVPAPDADGAVALEITATSTDTGGVTATTTDTIIVTVNAVNDAPVAQAGVAETPAGTPIGGQLYATDDDTSGMLIFALGTDAANGTVTVNADGSYTYTPADGFVGSDSFMYAVTDASGAVTTQTITVEVVPTIGIDTSGGTETQVNTTTSSNQDDPSIAGLADGGYVVIWESNNQDGSRDGIFGQRFDANGNTVGSEFQVNTTTSNHQFDPNVVGLDGGGFVVVYSSDTGDGSGDSILAQQFDSNGNTVGSEYLVNTTTSNNQREPSVAALEDGGFVVVFRSDSGDGSGDAVLAQRYDASGSTVGSEFLVNTTSGNNQFDAEVVGLSDGGFVVVWASDTGDGSADGVFSQRYDASGNTVGSEFQVNTTTSNNQWEPAVAALAGGGFVVVFRSDTGDGSSDAILAQQYDANGNTVGSEFLVNTYVSGNQMAPKVTGLLDGGYFVTWRSASGDGSGDAVFGQQYDQDGNTVGSEIQINDTTSGDQDTPDVTVLEDGSVVVVWESANLDGSGDAIAAKTYQAVSYGPHTMTGGAGNDSFIGGASGDTINAGAGSDTVEGGAGGDTLDGGAGNDTLAYAASSAGVTVDLGAGTASGGDAAGDTITNFENVIGSANADNITGDASDNVIEGGAGADTIDGAGGSDTASYAASTLAVNVSLASGTGTGGDAQGDVLSNIENLIGSDWDDTLTGDGGANVIEGGLGADVIDGGAGIDTVSYAGSTAAVTVDLGAGTASGGDAAGDTISNVENVTGSSFDDAITGDGGDNTLSGGMGDDTLTGGTGGDTLTGDAGNDLLIGGAGDDVFLFGTGDDADTVEGGLAGGWTDTIALDGVTGDYLTGDWTLTLTSGSIQSSGMGSVTLSQDAEGTIIVSDGSTVTFEGVEQIQW